MKPDDILDYPEASEPTPLQYFETLYNKSPWYGKILLDMLQLILKLVLFPLILVLGIVAVIFRIDGLPKAKNDIPTSI